jgi:hypothetical protein
MATSKASPVESTSLECQTSRRFEGSGMGGRGIRVFLFLLFCLDMARRHKSWTFIVMSQLRECQTRLNLRWKGKGSSVD